LVEPVPGAAADRTNGTTPRVLVNDSSGSVALNGMLAVVPFSWRSPKVWSRNWPQTNPHCDTPRCEKTFTLTSLKIRLETARALGPETVWLLPSAYRAGDSRR
jgi:hypothetical protein